MKRKKSLAQSRPPSLRHSKPALSSRATRTIIRSHHRLEKALARALAADDAEASRDVSARLDAQGGLERYQQASMLGQSADRGGDTSRVLVDWLLPTLHPQSCDALVVGKGGKPLRVLEVGALSVDNFVSRAVRRGKGEKVFDVTRIDLNAQHPRIKKQDFMTMTPPSLRANEEGRDGEEEGFDVLSLSLVLNFVPDAVQRGEMLRRTKLFLRRPRDSPQRPCSGDVEQLGRHRRRGSDPTGEGEAMFPCLFLVLPAPCITNSRYFDEATLLRIMAGLGFVLLRSKTSAKLAYYLFRLLDNDGGAAGRGLGAERGVAVPKREVNPGKVRNNFCVVLRAEGDGGAQ